MNPRVSILVGTRQRCEFLQRCLQSFESLPPGFAEVIVIDAGSTDGTRDFLSTQEGILTVLEDTPSGQAAGLNKGAKLGTAPYICWLSDDNRLRPRALEAAVAILEADTHIGMVGLRVKDTCGHYVWHPFIGGASDAGVITCNQGIMRREIFDRIGGFDEQLRDYLIDSDITTKVLLDGSHVVHLRKVAIDHDRERGDDSWMSVEKRKAQTKRNTDIYNERYASYVLEASESIQQRKKCLAASLMKALFKHEFDSFRSRAHVSLPEFYRSYILYAKAQFVAPEDVCPPHKTWSLRQIPRPPQPADLATPEAIHEAAIVRRWALRSIVGNFEALGYLHSRSTKLTKALLVFGIVKLVGRRSTDKNRFFHFVMWATGLPEILARFVLDTAMRGKKAHIRPQIPVKQNATLEDASSSQPTTANEEGTRQEV